MYFHYNIYFCIVSIGSVTVVVQIKTKTMYREVRIDRICMKTSVLTTRISGEC